MRSDDGYCEAAGLQRAGQIALEAAGGLHHDQIDCHPGKPRHQAVMARIVVGERLDRAGHAQSGIEGVLGDVDADDDWFRHVPLLPSLPMRSGVQQLFAHQRNGHGGAPLAQRRARTRVCRPRGETGCTAAPKTAGAVDLWTVGRADPRLSALARSPVDKPWKTPSVSHRLPTGRRLPTSSTAYQSQRSYS